ncbi:MAG: nitroreductase/quinone reductase family protein [Candidatus Nanopelagicales bacterium]|nr:nitroreductase/quinone reductase family protein [Candidatus Nanopelagicales bacterium]MDZ4250255.1 nitroreductase/quinone reductase family protein [Candidatus Nanopelagicales bacterium]
MKYRDVMRWLGNKKWFAWTAARLAPADAAVLRRTGGRFGLMGNYGLPQCLVTTTGRKSGQPRTVTLLYGTRAEEIILIGSNFGQQHHPAWALNLAADPHATVTTDGVENAMVARQITEPAEREAIWELMYSIWPAYHAYRGRAGREIMIFALSPA